MALIIKDRVQETSTTSGTGTLTLAGAVTGYQSFASAIGNGNTTYYAIYETQTSNWEVGVGTVGSGTLARTTVLASSNAGSLVNFGGGQLAVWGDMPAAKGVYVDGSGNVTGYAISGGTIDNTVIGGTTPAAITGSTITANTKFVSQDFYAQSILGGNLRTSSGTSLLNWDGGGSGNITINGGLIADPSNKNINLSPTGTGNVVISPATSGSMDNMVIGGTTPKAITGTTITATTFSGSGASLTSIPNSALVNSSITINGTPTALGGSISVGSVTSVSGTGTVNGITLSGTVTSSGNLTLGGTIDLTGITINGGSF